MRTRVTLALFMAFPVASHAATAIVLDPDDRPVADAAVMCSKHASDAVLSGPDGRVVLPEWCRALTCMTGAYLPGRADVLSDSVVCRLVAGTRVTVRLDPPGCGAQCFALLRPLGEGSHGASGSLRRGPGSGISEARFDLVRPGSYIVLLYDPEHGWQCGRSVEFPQPGETLFEAIWRPPVELSGVVVDDAGLPADDIPIRARSVVSGEDDVTAEWRCEGNDDAPDRFSAADGSFRVPVDPDARTVIEAGSSWDPDGHVEIVIAPPLPESVTLRLRKGGG